MKCILAFLIVLCCLMGAAIGESVPYFEEKSLAVHDISKEYIQLERGVVRYFENIDGSEVVYDCGMKCAVISDSAADGERILEVRLTLLVDNTDPGHIFRALYAYPTVYDYYSGRRCTIRDSIGAQAIMKPVVYGEELSVKGRVTDSDYIVLDNYTVYTVDYRFEMPEGYDGTVIGCFPAFEFMDHDDFMEKKKSTNYKWPDEGPGGVFIRVK